MMISPSLQLTWMYRVLTALCLFMIFWILFVPGSWMFGRSQFHDQVAGRYLKYLGERGLVPPSFFTKYQGHPAIHWTHLLPAALWCAIIPLQLHETIRRKYKPLHRVLGNFFVVSALLVALGLGIILWRGMIFEKSFPDLEPPLISFEPLIVANNIYFTFCILYAYQLARGRQWHHHQRWIIRHVASGMFVSLQRILIAVLFGPFYPPPVSREAQRDIFGQAGLLGMVLSIAAGEYAIFLLDLQRHLSETSPQKNL